MSKVIALTFPAGKRYVATATGAGNAAVNVSPGAGQRWLILFGEAKYVADANAANRQMILSLDDGTTQTLALGTHTTVITANQTKYVGISNRTASKTITEINIGEWSLPPDTILEGADRLILSAATNGVAGDAQSIRLTVLAGPSGVALE